MHNDHVVEYQAHNAGDGDQEEAEPEEFDDVEGRVHEVIMQVVPGERDVRVEERQMDVDESTAAIAFMQSQVGARKGSGPNLAPPSSQLITYCLFVRLALSLLALS